MLSIPSCVLDNLWIADREPRDDDDDGDDDGDDDDNTTDDGIGDDDVDCDNGDDEDDSSGCGCLSLLTFFPFSGPSLLSFSRRRFRDHAARETYAHDVS